MVEIKEVDRRKFEEIVKQGAVLADFYASWCGPCRMMGEVLADAVKDFPAETVVVKVNIDAEPALAAAHNVMTVPHLILFRDGKKITEAVGVQSRSALLGMLDVQ